VDEAGVAVDELVEGALGALVREVVKKLLVASHAGSICHEMHERTRKGFVFAIDIPWWALEADGEFLRIYCV